MTPRQTIFAFLLSIAILGIIIELVRRRRLREEYSWLWILTGVLMMVFALWYGALVALTHAIGAVQPTSTLFLFGLIFLMLLGLHFSVKLSALTDQVKRLAQHMALLESAPPRAAARPRKKGRASR